MASDGVNLSDREKRQLRAEEIFRAEVRRELEAASTPAPKGALGKLAASPLLNSPIVLWFLSSVVIAGLGWAWAEWDERRAAVAADRAEINRLSVEIYGRLERADRRMGGTDNLPGFREAVRYLDEGTGVIPALSDRSLESLLVAMSWLLPLEDRGSINAAREAYDAVRLRANDPGSDIGAALELGRQDLETIGAVPGVRWP